MIIGTDIQEKMELLKKIKLSFVQAINRESQDNQNALFLDRDIWEKTTSALKWFFFERSGHTVMLKRDWRD